MKTKIIILTTILLMICTGMMFAKDKNKNSNKETVVFDVTMTCENCKKRIEKKIAYEKGVTDMNVDLPSKTVEIEYKKDKTTIDKLQKAIEDLGYTAVIHVGKPEDKTH